MAGFEALLATAVVGIQTGRGESTADIGTDMVKTDDDIPRALTSADV